MLNQVQGDEGGSPLILSLSKPVHPEPVEVAHPELVEGCAQTAAEPERVLRQAQDERGESGRAGERGVGRLRTSGGEGRRQAQEKREGRADNPSRCPPIQTPRKARVPGLAATRRPPPDRRHRYAPAGRGRLANGRNGADAPP